MEKKHHKECYHALQESIFVRLRFGVQCNAFCFCFGIAQGLLKSQDRRRVRGFTFQGQPFMPFFFGEYDSKVLFLFHTCRVSLSSFPFQLCEVLKSHHKFLSYSSSLQSLALEKMAPPRNRRKTVWFLHLHLFFFPSAFVYSKIECCVLYWSRVY